MLNFFRLLFKEALIVLILGLGGWVLLTASAFVLNDARAHFWEQTIALKPEYAVLSDQEKAKAYEQFIAPTALHIGDEMFRQGGWGLRLAYAAQAFGVWLHGAWLLVYLVIVFIRLIVMIRSGLMTQESEWRFLGMVVLLAGIWFIVWGVLAPAGYIIYKRFYAQQFDYLWNARLGDFRLLAQGWPLVLVLYPVSILIRILRRGKTR